MKWIEIDPEDYEMKDVEPYTLRMLNLHYIEEIVLKDGTLFLHLREGSTYSIGSKGKETIDLYLEIRDLLISGGARSCLKS